ncbi:structural maintenance of chromosome protein [Reticulomyxa filosa]|uniref:Structural maintenance of chromosome protein n=1 Tax=Reticulomyxa filosa TaxID=46433 RepID=X6NTU4_RETFI|nr:structural maintenance of chromosome protein [Reticulomyxa filosa]|eukprot:ETO29720.1 structural maintenance of chromosome protein [Reticulomyxa filosa]
MFILQANYLVHFITHRCIGSCQLQFPKTINHVQINSISLCNTETATEKRQLTFSVKIWDGKNEPVFDVAQVICVFFSFKCSYNTNQYLQSSSLPLSNTLPLSAQEKNDQSKERQQTKIKELIHKLFQLEEKEKQLRKENKDSDTLLNFGKEITTLRNDNVTLSKSILKLSEQLKELLEHDITEYKHVDLMPINRIKILIVRYNNAYKLKSIKNDFLFLDEKRKRELLEKQLQTMTLQIEEINQMKIELHQLQTASKYQKDFLENLKTKTKQLQLYKETVTSHEKVIAQLQKINLNSNTFFKKNKYEHKIALKICKTIFLNGLVEQEEK